MSPTKMKKHFLQTELCTVTVKRTLSRNRRNGMCQRKEGVGTCVSGQPLDTRSQVMVQIAVLQFPVVLKL